MNSNSSRSSLSLRFKSGNMSKLAALPAILYLLCSCAAHLNCASFSETVSSRRTEAMPLSIEFESATWSSANHDRLQIVSVAYSVTNNTSKAITVDLWELRSLIILVHFQIPDTGRVFRVLPPENLAEDPIDIERRLATILPGDNLKISRHFDLETRMDILDSAGNVISRDELNAQRKIQYCMEAVVRTFEEGVPQAYVTIGGSGLVAIEPDRYIDR